MSQVSKRKIVQLNADPDQQTVNEALRQLCEMIYTLEGRRGSIVTKDQVHIQASTRATPLRIAGGRRANASFGFGSTENASLYMAKGAFLNDSGSWIAEDSVAVILELNRDSSTPQMFRNTGLTPGQMFQPTSSGWIAIGSSTGGAVVDLTQVQARSERGQPNGYASLDASGELPVSMLPDGWEDLRFPAAAINITGLAAPPSRDADTGLLSFSGSVDNTMAGFAQMPHSWIEGSTIYPHLHLRFPTGASANTRWKFEYSLGAPTGNFTTTYATYTDGGTITVANPNTPLKHVMAAFAAVSMVGYTISTGIMWRVSRLANSDGADNDSNATILLEFDIHYQMNSLGSVSATAK